MERSVKSRAGRAPDPARSEHPTTRTKPPKPLLAAALLGWGLSAAAALARPPQSLERPLLLGGTVPLPATEVRLDPLLPRGALVLAPTPEAELECSLRRPVCVGPNEADIAASDKPAPAAARLLAWLEEGYELAVLGRSAPSIGLGPRRPEGALVWSPGGGDLHLGVERRPSRGFDRGRGVCRGGSLTRETALRCVTMAAFASSVPSTAPWIADGHARLLASALGEPLSAELAAGAAAREPELGVLEASIDGRAFEFFRYLEERAEPERRSAALAWALFLSATKTPPGALRWNAEPDVVDVLRATLGSDRNEVARYFDASARERLNRTPTVRRAWSIDEASLPRALALPRPLTPTGSAYVEVKLTRGPRTGRSIAFRGYCEGPVSYVWSLARMNAGAVSSSVLVAFQERGTSFEARIGELDEADSVVLVGTNLGGIDLAHPFDPDHAPHEAHGCTISVDPLPLAGPTPSATP